MAAPTTTMAAPMTASAPMTAMAAPMTTTAAPMTMSAPMTAMAPMTATIAAPPTTYAAPAITTPAVQPMQMGVQREMKMGIQMVPQVVGYGMMPPAQTGYGMGTSYGSAPQG